MTRHCPHCRHVNPDWAHFCAQCGSQIDPVRPTADPAPPVADVPNPTARATPPATPSKPRTGQRLLLLFTILLLGFGWFVVMLPPSRRHMQYPVQLSQGPHDLLFENAPAPIDTNLRLTSLKTFHEDEDLVDAMFRLLRPNHVPIRVQRVDDRAFTAQGTPEQIEAIDRFLRQLKSGGVSFRKRIEVYTLPTDQAEALADALETSRKNITVRRDESQLHVRASSVQQDAIRELMKYLEPPMQSMVDISDRHGY